MLAKATLVSNVQSLYGEKRVLCLINMNIFYNASSVSCYMLLFQLRAYKN